MSEAMTSPKQGSQQTEYLLGKQKVVEDRMTHTHRMITIYCQKKDQINKVANFVKQLKYSYGNILGS